MTSFVTSHSQGRRAPLDGRAYRQPLGVRRPVRGVGAQRGEGHARLFAGAKLPTCLPVGGGSPRKGREPDNAPLSSRFPQGQGGCYVQDAFAAGGGIKDPSTTGAVIVGQKPMAEAITGMLTAAGVPKERILFNF